MNNTYIKLTDNNSDFLTHYGVKGMKWRKRKEKVLDVAWEIAHPLRGATNEHQLDNEIVERKESRRTKTTKTYRIENGKKKLITSKTIDKKTGKQHKTAGKKALDKLVAAGKVKTKARDMKNNIGKRKYKTRH